MRLPRHRALACALSVCAVFGVQGLPAQSVNHFATTVHSYQPGPGVGSYGDPGKALGAPQGAGGTSGGLDVVTLGVGGSLTLGFAAPIYNGPGTDFVVFENGFFKAPTLECFAEVFFVEVSSNGVDFARFETAYVGPQRSDPFLALPPGAWSGLGGTTPALANGALRPGIDARDAARAGGDSFDLEALRSHPLVAAHKLNLYRITHVRLIDVEDNKHRDALGRWIRDPSVGSADIDAVAVRHFLGHLDRNAPVALLELTAGRHMRLTIRDEEGLFDLDAGKLFFSVQGLPFDFFALFGFCRFVQADSKGFTLETLFPFERNTPIKVGVSVRDLSGRLGSDELVLH